MDKHGDLIVKICGLRDATAAQVAIDSGADALGFILAPSRRQVAPEEIRAIRGALRLDADRPQMVVGVFVNAGSDEINQAADVAGLDAVQLSGDESPSILQEIERPVIKALRFAAGTSLEGAFEAIDAWYAASKPVTRVLIEGHHPGSYGGTGAVVDWDFAGAVAARYPIILAGGLTPENVTEAIKTVVPAGVDVSSGVETDGSKDTEKIRQFIVRARSSQDAIDVPEV